MAEIRIKHVAKTFGSFQALNSIDLTISDQEFMVLLGASGCGKTTLLRIIAGLETMDSGEVWIGERRVDHLPPRLRGIAMVFQNYAIFPHLTVFNNIGFGLKMHKMPAAEIKRRVEKNAELMHIEHLLGRYSGELSGGQRQRVALARAIADKPEILLFDEPTSGLDPITGGVIDNLIKDSVTRLGATAITISHDMASVRRIADKVAMIHNGVVIWCGPVEQMDNTGIPEVDQFVHGKANGPLTTAINADALDKSQGA